MRKLFFTILFLVSILNSNEITRIIGVSEQWDKATEPNCKGFYWNIAKEVFSLSNIKLECKLVPYERSVYMVDKGDADFWVASYLNEEEFAIYPKYHFDADIVSALYDKNKTNIKDKKDLENKKIAWVRGYAYNQYLNEKMDFIEINNRQSGIKMVQFGRIDAFLDAKIELDNVLNKLKKIPKNLAMSTVIQLPLYMAFKNNEKGKKLANIWDTNLKKLHDNGKLKTIYDEADYTKIYPFKE